MKRNKNRRTVEAPTANKMQLRGLKMEYRADATASDADALVFSVSSDVPYLMPFGYEILEHTSDAVDLSRFNDGAAIMVDHYGDQVGVIERAYLESGKLYIEARFSKYGKGAEVEGDIKDGIRRNVSIGYIVYQYDTPAQREMINDMPVYRAIKWMPYEASIVSVPADITVGLGRSLDDLTQHQMEMLKDLLAKAMKDDTKPAEETPEEEATESPEEEAAEEATEDTQAEDTSTEDTTTDTTDDTTEEDDKKTESKSLNTSETPKRQLVISDNTTTSDADSANDTAADEADPQPAHSSRTYSQETDNMKSNVETVTNPNITLSDKEQKAYSLSRALLNAADGKRSGLEFEISDTIEKSLGKEVSNTGFYMPTSVRSISIGDSSTGGAITFTQPGEFVDYLRNRAVVAGLGATVMTLPNKVALPRLTSDFAATWIAEDGSGASYASASFDQVIMSPKKLQSYTGYSRETLTVANVDVESLVRDSIYKSFVTAFDKAALQGAGSPAPTGLLNFTGLQSGSNSGSALTYAGALEVWQKVAESNADMGSLKYVCSPAVFAKAAATIRSGSTANFIIEDNQINGYDVAVSNNLGTLAGGGVMVFGDWTSIIMAEFGSIEVIVDPYTAKHKGLIEVGATMLADIQFKHINSFAIQKGLVTS